MSGRRQDLRLEIEQTGAGGLVGRVAAAGAQPKPFTGWLGLMAAIRAACEPAPGGGPAGDDNERGGTSR
jgi:hypothetical protein